MICERLSKSYCAEYWNIENYDLAINDDTQTWHCHHRKETDENMSVKELIELGLYYNRPASELIFLTHTDHKSLHAKFRTGEKNPLYGKPAWNKGIKATEETRKKQSELRKGKQPSEESNRKRSMSMMGEKNPLYGKTCYNNGIKNVYAFECPEGYVKGMLKRKHLSYEHRIKLSESHKGQTPWNKGLKTGPLTIEHRNKISEANKGISKGQKDKHSVDDNLPEIKLNTSDEI